MGDDMIFWDEMWNRSVSDLKPQPTPNIENDDK